MIFQRLAKALNFEDELFVSALYTRRGGIDICPSRWKNCRVADVEKLIDIGVFARCGIKQ
jgi:NADPH-dependent 7-cyano-7-deazaguanine reductase QueF